jgi:metal-responsive CopG/Arc/MetJ family transcriptional regulator
MSKTPLRAIRIDDELWEAAQAKAAQDGDNLSAVIRDALRAYIQEDEEV